MLCLQGADLHALMSAVKERRNRGSHHWIKGDAVAVQRNTEIGLLMGPTGLAGIKQMFKLLNACGKLHTSCVNGMVTAPHRQYSHIKTAIESN
jgi:hypothetical protein